MYVYSEKIKEYVGKIQYVNKTLPVLLMHGFQRSYPPVHLVK